MSILKKIEEKISKEIYEITCSKCGKTLRNYKNNKDRHICNECYSKILDK